MGKAANEIRTFLFFLLMHAPRMPQESNTEGLRPIQLRWIENITAVLVSHFYAWRGGERFEKRNAKKKRPTLGNADLPAATYQVLFDSRQSGREARNVGAEVFTVHAFVLVGAGRLERVVSSVAAVVIDKLDRCRRGREEVASRPL